MMDIILAFDIVSKLTYKSYDSHTDFEVTNEILEDWKRVISEEHEFSTWQFFSSILENRIHQPDGWTDQIKFVRYHLKERGYNDKDIQELIDEYDIVSVLTVDNGENIFIKNLFKRLGI